jgi:hypothetical protein
MPEGAALCVEGRELASARISANHLSSFCRTISGYSKKRMVNILQVSSDMPYYNDTQSHHLPSFLVPYLEEGSEQ